MSSDQQKLNSKFGPLNIDKSVSVKQPFEINIREKIPQIAKMGWILSKKQSDTGIGFTFEELMGIPQNNRKGADFLFEGKKVELKTQRKASKSLVTLFSAEPEKAQIKDKQMLMRYGHPYKEGQPGLYVEVNAILANRQGLILEIEKAANQLYIKHQSDGRLWFWDINKLKLKIDRLLIILCDTAMKEGNEYFRCQEAYYLSGFDSQIFFGLLKSGKIVTNLRMHLNVDGSVRNRGTAFRGKFEAFRSCYSYNEMLINAAQHELFELCKVRVSRNQEYTP